MRTVAVTAENQKSFDKMLLWPVGESEGKRLVLGILDDDKPVGTVILDDTGENIEIESIYILPEYRRKSIGTALIDDIIQAGVQKNSMFLTAQFPDSRQELVSFFLSCGFLLTEGPDIYSFRQTNVVRNKKTSNLIFREYKGICKEVQILSGQEKALLQSFLSKRGFSEAMLESPGFHPVLSSCVFRPSDRLQAVMLCSEFGNDIVVDLTLGRGEDNTAVMLTFRHLFEELKHREQRGKLPENGRVLFQAARESVINSAIKVFNADLTVEDFLVFAVREFS